MFPLRAAWIGSLLGGSISIPAHGFCPEPGHDWLLVAFESSQPSQIEVTAQHQLESRVIEHLRAEFASQSIDVCTENPAPGSRPALANLRIEKERPDAAFVRAWVNDEVTDKAVSRRLSLAGLPRDAHALAIADGASELLRASWAELRLRSEVSTRGTVPASVVGVVDEHERSSSNHGAISIGTGFEAFKGGIKQGGLDAEIGYSLSANWDVAVRVGGRSSLRANATDGSISANGWIVGTAAHAVIAKPIETLRLTFDLQLNAMHASFVGDARQGATAQPRSGTTSWAAAGVGADWWVYRKLALNAGLLIGHVLVPVVATDSGQRVLGFTQQLVEAHAGLKIPF